MLNLLIINPIQMILFPKLITKICLILLCGLITFHIAFVNSERYSSKIGPDLTDVVLKVNNIPENIYEYYLENYLYDISKMYSEAFFKPVKCIDQFIANTKKTYIFGLHENTKNYIYFGYFIVISTLIFYAKFEQDEK